MPRTATTEKVSTEQLLAFLQTRHHAVLLTRKRDGGPQLSPVTAGEHPDWPGYREAMTRQGKVLLRVTLERWGPVATGGFPPELAS